MLGLLWSPLSSKGLPHRPYLSIFASDEGIEDPSMASTEPDRLEEELARTWFHHEGLMLPPSNLAEPLSLQWFLALEHARYGRHGHWLPELLGFAKHRGETVVCLGNNLGTDGVQYARQGAQVIVCHPQQQQLQWIRRNYELRNLQARFLHAPGDNLPLLEGTADVVCYSAPVAETVLSEVLIDEIYRVLKPGGKVVAVLPARAPSWWRWLTADKREPVRRNGFGTRQLRQHFPQFENHRLWRRYLRRRHLVWPMRWLPRTVLERLVGRFLILNAFKPVGSVLLRAAA